MLRYVTYTCPNVSHQLNSVKLQQLFKYKTNKQQLRAYDKTWQKWKTHKIIVECKFCLGERQQTQRLAQLIHHLQFCK